MTVSLTLKNIRRLYVKDNEEFAAVDNVNLEVKPGEFLTFLGPSGCGKTTTLRMVAGFETPTSGQILVDGADITHVPANERGLGFVFQNYALFPHMKIFDNVAYGLRIRGDSASVIKDKVRGRLQWWAWPKPKSGIRTSSPGANSSEWRWRASWSCGQNCF